MHLCMRACVFARARTCMRASIYLYVLACLRERACLRLCIRVFYSCVRVCASLRVFICVYMCHTFPYRSASSVAI